MEMLRSDRTSVISRCYHSPSTNRPAPCVARGRRCNHAEHDHLAWHPATHALVILSEAVRDKVAWCMRQTPVLEVSTTDEGTSSDEEPIPVLQMKNS